MPRAAASTTPRRHDEGDSLSASASLLVLAASACKQELVVENLSDPDIARVFATGRRSKRRSAPAIRPCTTRCRIRNDEPGVEVFGLESFSSLNNFNMGTRVGDSAFADQQRHRRAVDFQRVLLPLEGVAAHRQRDGRARGAREGRQDDRHAGAATSARARSGSSSPAPSLGWLAMIYDSAGDRRHGNADRDSIPPLSGAQDVTKAALVMLDSALAIANDPACGERISARGHVAEQRPGLGTLDQFKRLIRSYRARFRAGVARTPAQRAAVDWAKVIDDTENGITRGPHGERRRLDRLEPRHANPALPGSDVESDVA